MPESIKDMGIAVTFIVVASIGMLFFAIGLPILNNEQSVLVNNPVYNNTINNLSSNLNISSQQINTNINITSQSQPTTNTLSTNQPSKTYTSLNFMSQITSTMSVLMSSLGNIFGLNGGQFTVVAGAFIAMFGFVILYFTIRFISWSY